MRAEPLTVDDALVIVRDAAAGGLNWQQTPLEFTIRSIAMLVLKLADERDVRPVPKAGEK